MDNSIKVKINYHPVNFMQIALWIMILFAVPCFWLASYSDSFSLLLLGLVAVILTAVVAGVLSSAKAVVYANDEKLCRRYMNKDSVIMLSDVTEISYSVCTEHHGRYAEQRLLLTLKTNDGTVHQLMILYQQKALSPHLIQTARQISRSYSFTASLRSVCPIKQRDM